MSLWQEVVATAFLGTRRRGLTLGPTGKSDELDRLLGRLNVGEPGTPQGGENEQAPISEHALLCAAAAISLHKRAGQMQIDAVEFAPQPCQGEKRRRCNQRMAQGLVAILGGKFKEVLPECLNLLARADQRVPEETLPELLELGRQRVDIQNILPVVVGERGRWMAGQNAEWAYLLGNDEDSVWRLGNRAARAAALSRMRARDPEQARQWLEASWSTEPQSERLDFLNALKPGLSLADEPFLESILEERDEQTSRRAATLLAHLPASRLVQRMIERVEPLVSLGETHPFPFARIIPDGAVKPFARLTVTLPDQCDSGMIRDGVDPKRKRFFGPDMGDKGWWVRQMLSVIPPSRWCQKFNMTPTALIEAAGRGEWRYILIGGWEGAAQIHRDSEWAVALLKSGNGKTESPFSVSPTKGLITAMTPEGRERFLLEWFETGKKPLALDRSGLLMLEACDHPWSARLSQVVIEELSRVIRDAESHQYWQRRPPVFGASSGPGGHIWAVLERFGLAIDPALAGHAEEILLPAARGQKLWENPVTLFVEMLKFRQNMRKDILDEHEQES